MSERTDDAASEGPQEDSPEERRALFRVVRGRPSDAEIAALTVVLAAAASGADQPTGRTRPRSHWSDTAARLRRPLRPGPGAWRASAWPR